MATDSQSYQQRNEDRRKRVVLCIDDDFLRPSVTESIPSVDPRLQQFSQQELNDRALALQMQQQLHLRSAQISQNYVGQLVVIVVEAALVKSYRKVFGFNMDPYARLSIGSTVYETHACPSGGRTPRWNKRIQSYLPAGVKTFNIEIYDESAFTIDELVAFASIQIPEAVFRHESVESWFPLSGKQGDDKEGSIHLIISLMPISNVLPLQMAVSPYGGQYPIGGPQMIMMPGYNTPYTVYNPTPGNVASALPSTVNVATPVLPKPLTEEETKEIESMFPSIDRQVIQSVIEACGQRRDAVIDSLLQISEQ